MSSRICPDCQTGIIAPDDLHRQCEGCLGPEHAGRALTPQVACAFCRLLSPQERQRRVEFFTVAAEEPFTTEELTQDDVVDLFDAGQESDDSARSVDSANSSPVPAPQAGGPEPLEPEEAPLEPFSTGGVPQSTATPLPAIGALLRELPDIIRKAAAFKGLPVPEAQSPAPPDDMAGKFASGHSSRRDPVWPRFPAITAYQTGSAVEPGKLRAPVSTYAPITRVEGFTERGFPPVPPLEPSLSSVFGVRGARNVGRRPCPPAAKDQLTARFADRTHQCAFQASAAANNIALLAFGLNKMAAEPDLASRAEDVANAASAILNLCAATAVATARIASWQHLIHRNVWLHSSPSIPEEVRKELLEGPISPDGLFGPHFQSLLEHLQRSSEEAERFKRHVARPTPEPRQSRPTGHWRDRRDQRQRQRRSTTVAANASRPTPPATVPAQMEPAASTQGPQQRGPRSRPLACSWTNPPARETPRRPRKQ